MHVSSAAQEKLYMKQTLQLRIGQQLTMTPQLQQAIRLLQLSTLELQTEVQDALESNPMLEQEDGENDLPESESTAPQTPQIPPNPAVTVRRARKAVTKPSPMSYRQTATGMTHLTRVQSVPAHLTRPVPATSLKPSPSAVAAFMATSSGNLN
jgi:DNA-directed RNA polymerase specialized sigma54-like protein